MMFDRTPLSATVGVSGSEEPDMPPNNRLQRTALCAVVFCGCAAFARCRLSLRPLRFVLPPSHQRAP